MTSVPSHPTHQLRAHLLTRHFPAAFFHAAAPLFYVLAAQQRNLLFTVLPYECVAALTVKSTVSAGVPQGGQNPSSCFPYGSALWE